jgi:transposase InsO family protein
VVRSTFYRLQKPVATVPKTRPKPPSPRALSAQEQATVLDLLNSERFQNQAPREAYATLLDDGIYVCHWSSMYRLSAENQEVSERRNQLVHPAAVKPELVARAPDQVWSWDITKLLALMLSDLGVTKSHSRPRVSVDNPYSEAQFCTKFWKKSFQTYYHIPMCHSLLSCRFKEAA